jgi:NAD(P)-dependent dehydrogenase (short-subunit alcohol dehydrogenase family)
MAEPPTRNPERTKLSWERGLSQMSLPHQSVGRSQVSLELERDLAGDVAIESGRALAREMNATFIAADLVDPMAARKLFDAAEQATLGFVSILVHSASPRRRENVETALAVTESEWDSMVTVGLRAGFCPRSSSRGANAGAQNQRTNAIYHFAARPHAAQLTALQRDKSRPNDDRERTCTCPRSRRFA